MQVLILSPDAKDYLPLLRELDAFGCEIHAASNARQALAGAAGAEVVLGQPDLVAAVLDELPQVKWVQSSWAGVAPLLEHGRSDYLLSSVKDTFGPQMTEYVLTYLLAHEWRLLERLGRQANRNWWPEPGGSLQGKVLGIMGTGSIGSHIARSLRPFGLSISGFSRSGAPVEGFDQVFPAARLEAFLRGLDYLVCVLPDTSETRGLLDRRAFSQMKPGCFLVNAGRGSVLDEEALAAALNEGALAGAALDVFRTEPLPESSPLWHARGALLTAHVAAQSHPRDIAAIFVENFRRYAGGRNLEYIVDFKRGY